jgi:hypothetical protein
MAKNTPTPTPSPETCKPPPAPRGEKKGYLDDREIGPEEPEGRPVGIVTAECGCMLHIPLSARVDVMMSEGIELLNIQSWYGMGVWTVCWGGGPKQQQCQIGCSKSSKSA